MERQLAKHGLDNKSFSTERAEIGRDPLTGLLTRHSLHQHLDKLLSADSTRSSNVSLLFIGLDRFKSINRNFGQQTGDLTLIQVTARLAECMGATAALFRLGGDEFALCLDEVLNNADLSIICERISAAIDMPLLVLGREINVTCSIGIASFPSDARNAFTLFHYAELALQQAKESGRHNWRRISDEFINKTQHRSKIAEALRSAIDSKQLRLHYQPVVELQNGKMCGVEALIRWVDPEIGTVPALRLIEIAEESGLISEVGNWVLRQACEDMRFWSEHGVAHFPVAINVSPVQLRDPLFAEKLGEVLQEANIPPEMLFVEITEGVLMQNPTATIVLEKLRSLRVNLILDDFGTGYSSLNHLKRLPLTKVKIDRSFIKSVHENADDAAISKAIISMAHSLGIRVVAEGVETEAQCSFLSQNMCDEIQGYLFSDAISASEVAVLVQQGGRLPERLLRMQKPQRTLLLVDDEGNIISSLRRLLRDQGLRILTANCGQAGLDILAENAVDVIVSDQRMPGMTGVEFLGKAKELYPDTVRIVLSGYTELHSVTDAVNEGAIYKFLTKPWDDDQLRGHIEEAFRRKGMADENRRLNLEVLTANQELAEANHQLEEILRQKQQQITRDEVSLDIIREVLQQIPLAVIGVDDDDVVVFANDAAQNLFDNTPSILGSDVNQLVPDLVHASSDGRHGMHCTVELGRRFFEVVARRMGRGSQSRGKLMTISPLKITP